MKHDDRSATGPWASDDELEAGLRELLAGPSPHNRVHGAIDLEPGDRHARRPSQASIDAARLDILAGLWGL
jgi:hypothetical protein